MYIFMGYPAVRVTSLKKREEREREKKKRTNTSIISLVVDFPFLAFFPYEGCVC